MTTFPPILLQLRRLFQACLMLLTFASMQHAVAADPLPVISSFAAQPATINSGDATVLSWTVSNGSLWISADNGGDVGDVRGKTSVTVKPKVTTRYTLTASSGAGNVTKSVTVTVNKVVLPTIASFAPTPSTIAAGGTATLNWSVSNATSVSISPGTTVTGTSLQASPTATTTYTLTATNAKGSATKTTTVTVATPPVISTFATSAATVVAGNPVHLSWTATPGATLTLSPGGVVTGSGVDVTPAVTTTYSLVATNAAGSSAPASVQVQVTQPPPPPVIAAFTATPPDGGTGPTTLRWSVTGADTVSLDNGIGVVTGNSTTVNPAATTTYTLTASNAGTKATAVVTVHVAGSASAATIVSIHQLRQLWGESAWSSNSVLLQDVQAGDAIIVLGTYWVSSGTGSVPKDANGQLLAAVNQVPAYQHPPVASQIFYELNVDAGDHTIIPPDLAYGGDGTFYVVHVRGLTGLRGVGDTHADTNALNITTKLTTADAQVGDFIVAIGGEDDYQAYGTDAGMSAPPAGWQSIGVQNDANVNVPSAAYYTVATATGNQQLTFSWNDIYSNVSTAAIAAFSVNTSLAPAQPKSKRAAQK